MDIPDHLSETLIDPNRIEGTITRETRAFMTQMLEFENSPFDENSYNEDRQSKTVQENNTVQTLSKNLPPPPSGFSSSSIIPSLVALIGRMIDELDSHVSKLLALNPSRRAAISQHLDKLTGSIPSSPHSRNGETKPIEPQAALNRWVEGSRSPAQNQALRTYFQEVSIIALGQAILLKSWSDRGIRRWNETDVGKLNWALSTALKPHIPLDREGWQITRPNLYSWYNPTPILQHEIWTSLESWRLNEEGPGFLLTLLSPMRQVQAEVCESVGYDSRFFQYLWAYMHLFGFNGAPNSNYLKRNKTVFSPTLRDGALVRTCPIPLTWIGLEASPFQLMLAELMHIWWGPSAPPFWSIGTGLEVHTRDQLALALNSSKPSVLCRIAEMEACDAAFVLEEQCIRTQGRGFYSVRFREQLDKLPYFKRLRSPGTTLGDLQACVALSKLRPGGILVWAREEALSAKDGSEVLNFLLDRAKLCCEWDFSELEHALPSHVPLYPRHLYLLQKEPRLEARLAHRPVRHSIHGQMRSHVELPLVLEDSFQAYSRSVQPRGQWTILSHTSPTTQKEWTEKWPDPASQTTIRQLDHLRTASLPLASFTTIRPTPEGDTHRKGHWSLSRPLVGFWLTTGYDTTHGRKLITQNLPAPGQEAEGSGFLILVSDENWTLPLSAYLMSDLVHQWLDCHAERRGDRWIIHEQVLKWIPIPKILLQALGVPEASKKGPEMNPPGFAPLLPPSFVFGEEWEKLIAEITYHPKKVQEALTQLPVSESNLPLHATIFIRTAHALEHLRLSQSRLFSMVTIEGRIRWRQLLEVLPKGECATLSLHSRIRLSGSIPPHIPIGRKDRVKSPMPGILLTTESGFTLHIGSESSQLLTMVWEQLEDLPHPTWSEVLQYLRLPRKVELAESTALDVLRSHGEQTSQLSELRELLNTCRLF